MEKEIATKAELAAAIEREWQQLAEVVTALEPAEMEEPVLENGWSVKDTLAHVMSWEQYLIAWVGDLLAGSEPVRPFSGDDWVDRVNEQVYNEHRHVPPDEVREAFHRSHVEVESFIEALTPDVLFDTELAPWLQGNPLWQMVAANTFWHYREHREEIAGSRGDG